MRQKLSYAPLLSRWVPLVQCLAVVMKLCPAFTHVTSDLQTCVSEWQVSASLPWCECSRSLSSAAAAGSLSRACLCVQQNHKWGWFNTAGRQALSLRPVTGNLALPFLQESSIWWKCLYMTLLRWLVLSSCLSAYLILAWIFLSLGKYWAFEEEIWCLFSS